MTTEVTPDEMIELRNAVGESFREWLQPQLKKCKEAGLTLANLPEIFEEISLDVTSYLEAIKARKHRAETEFPEWYGKFGSYLDQLVDHNDEPAK